MASISYIEADEKGIDLIRPLWQQLNEHHRARSAHFSRHYEAFTFDRRKGDLLHKTKNGLLRIDLARDDASGLYVGYCVTSLVKDRERTVGEVESLFVSEAYRSTGIGDGLMKKAIAWMGSQGASVKKVAVGAGNEEVLPFYARYGFYPRIVILEQMDQ